MTVSIATSLTAYHLQAGIAACHAVASSYAATDWPCILSRYDALAEIAPSPVVVGGLPAGLAELARLPACAAITCSTPSPQPSGGKPGT